MKNRRKRRLKEDNPNDIIINHSKRTMQICVGDKELIKANLEMNTKKNIKGRKSFSNDKKSREK